MGWSRQQVTAVRIEVGPSIMLQSGAWLDLLAPHTSEFTIEDIAHGLALQCRYAGQCREFYSIAEHSILVSDIVQDDPLAALLHDAAEAFLGDITRPLKQMLPDYRRIEAQMQRAIFSRFDIDPQSNPAIKSADLSILAAEQSQMMPAGTDEWARHDGIESAPVKIRFLSPQKAKAEFLQRFETLWKN
jgi:5'-nucleotidase